jgi:hypothetical protein
MASIKEMTDVMLATQNNPFVKPPNGQFPDFAARSGFQPTMPWNTNILPPFASNSSNVGSNGFIPQFSNPFAENNKRAVSPTRRPVSPKDPSLLNVNGQYLTPEEILAKRDQLREGSNPIFTASANINLTLGKENTRKVTPPPIVPTSGITIHGKEEAIVRTPSQTLGGGPQTRSQPSEQKASSPPAKPSSPVKPISPQPTLPLQSPPAHARQASVSFRTTSPSQGASTPSVRSSANSPSAFGSSLRAVSPSYSSQPPSPYVEREQRTASPLQSIMVKTGVVSSRAVSPVQPSQSSASPVRSTVVPNQKISTPMLIRRTPPKTGTPPKMSTPSVVLSTNAPIQKPLLPPTPARAALVDGSVYRAGARLDGDPTPRSRDPTQGSHSGGTQYAVQMPGSTLPAGSAGGTSYRPDLTGSQPQSNHSVLTGYAPRIGSMPTSPIQTIDSESMVLSPQRYVENSFQQSHQQNIYQSSNMGMQYPQHYIMNPQGQYVSPSHFQGYIASGHPQMVQQPVYMVMQPNQNMQSVSPPNMMPQPQYVPPPQQMMQQQISSNNLLRSRPASAKVVVEDGVSTPNLKQMQAPSDPNILMEPVAALPSSPIPGTGNQPQEAQSKEGLSERDPVMGAPLSNPSPVRAEGVDKTAVEVTPAAAAVALSSSADGITENFLGPHLLNEEKHEGNATRPNYKEMTPEQQTEANTIFKAKFTILIENHPKWKIIAPPDTYTLDQKHTLYEIYVRKIVASMNTGQWKIYLILMWLCVEILCVKGLGIDASGYTKMQIASMNKYDTMLVKLGEKYHSNAEGSWSIEGKLIFASVFQCCVFMGIKFVTSYLGAESFAGDFQNQLEGILSGASGATVKPAVDVTGLPGVPTAGAAATNGGGLGGMLGNLLGGGGENISSLISGVTGMLGGGGGTAREPQPEGRRRKYNFSSS